MPLFEYQCSDCGETDERLVRSPAPESVACARCGGQAPRLVALPARFGGDCGSGSSGAT